MATGISKKHSRRCSKAGRCDCPYEAWVWSKKDGKKIRKRFDREADAKSWRADALNAIGKGQLRAPKPTTIAQAWDEWHAGAKEGTIRNRSGDEFKPSAIRSYERAMRLRVLPDFGPRKLAELTPPDLQDLVDRLLADGLNPSTIVVTLLPLRALYRRALARGELAVDPCRGLQMPAVRGGRERFASPSEAEALIAALPIEDRAVWATLFFAGIRRGEAMALRVDDVNLATGLIHVLRGWDDEEGELDLPKSHAGQRKVPIAVVLRDPLLDHLARTGRSGEDRIFGATAESPFNPRALTDRADRTWKAAGLERITPHECRHTYAALMIAAGVNAKALSTFMGHANISITLDKYGHLMPGSEDEAAGLLDAYLAAERGRAEDAARSATGAQAGAQGAEEAADPHEQATEAV